MMTPATHGRFLHPSHPQVIHPHSHQHQQHHDRPVIPQRARYLMNRR